MVAQAFNPNALEAETAGSLPVQGQPGLQSYFRTKIYRETISKIKIKEIEVKVWTKFAQRWKIHRES